MQSAALRSRSRICLSTKSCRLCEIIKTHPRRKLNGLGSDLVLGLDGPYSRSDLDTSTHTNRSAHITTTTLSLSLSQLHERQECDMTSEKLLTKKQFLPTARRSSTTLLVTSSIWVDITTQHYKGTEHALRRSPKEPNCNIHDDGVPH